MACSSCLARLQGGTALQGRIRPQVVVLQAPEVGQVLILSYRGEQLGVKKFFLNRLS